MAKKNKPLCEGKEKKSAAEWLKDVNENPEKFGTSATHIKAVDKKIRQLEEQANHVPKERKKKPDEDEVVEDETPEEKSDAMEEAALTTKEKWW